MDLATSAARWCLRGLRADDGPSPPPARPVPAEGSALRLWIGPLLLMGTTPWLGLGAYTIVTRYEASILAFARDFTLAGFLAALPRPSLAAVGILAAWTVFQALLLLLLPGLEWHAVPTPMGNRPRYRRNGVLAWLVTHVAWFAVTYGAGLFSPTVVWDHLGELLATLTPGAFLLCLALYAKGRWWPSSTDTVWTRNPVFDFFQGIELHPRMCGMSLKQLVNCRLSMMGWSVMLLSYAAAQVERLGHLTPALAVSVGLQVAYLFKFFVWETGYFNSLDVMHDRFGYYIAWGVLAWVPAIYTLASMSQVAHPSALPAWACAAMGALGLGALWINYDADAQRQRVRETGGSTRIWGRAPELVTASYRTADGHVRENLLLASGWWGVARHFHYVPELTLALMWSATAGFDRALPYFYFVFLTILLVDRARRDERRCAEKYGPAWDVYRTRVRWRMLPGVY